MQDVILFPFKFEFHLLLKIKHSLGVVVEVELNLITDFREGVQLDVLIEIELGNPALFDGECIVIGTVVQHTKNQLDIAGGTDVDGVATEDGLENVAAHVELRNQSAAATVTM